VLKVALDTHSLTYTISKTEYLTSYFIELRDN
jgi:hypothetical protein